VKGIWERRKESKAFGGKEISPSGTVTVFSGRGSPYIKLGLASDNHDERNQSPRGSQGKKPNRRQEKKRKE
jgi:hypothetical protein